VRGTPKRDRNIQNASFLETLRELTAIDGAIIVNAKGIVESAGTYLDAPRRKAKMKPGLGAPVRRLPIAIPAQNAASIERWSARGPAAAPAPCMHYIGFVGRITFISAHGCRRTHESESRILDRMAAPSRLRHPYNYGVDPAPAGGVVPRNDQQLHRRGRRGAGLPGGERKVECVEYAILHAITRLREATVSLVKPCCHHLLRFYTPCDT
jgi:hypothetical protein